MNHNLNKHLTIKPNEEAKQRIKSAMQSKHGKTKSRKFSFHQLSRIPKPVAVGAVVLVLLASTLFGVNLSRNPLTAERVIANALEAIDKNQSRGQWQLTKTKEEITQNGKVVVTYTDAWVNTSMGGPGYMDEADFSDQSMMDSSYKSVLEDGRVLTEFVVLDGKSYERDTRVLVKEIMGYDPYAIADSLSSDYSSMPLPPGFKEAGLTNDSYEQLSMKEIDDALKAAGQPTMFESTYKSTNFPAYTMKPDELNKLTENYEENIKQDPKFFEKLYGGDDNYKAPSTVYTSDGRMLSGEEGEKYMAEQQSTYQNMESLRSGTLEDKKKALETLQKKGGAKLITDVYWDGRAVIGIDLSQGSAQMPGTTQILYLDAKTYEMVGEEYKFDPSASGLSGITGMITPTNVRITYLEQYFTNDRPNLSIDGLVPTETLYNLPKPEDQ